MKDWKIKWFKMEGDHSFESIALARLDNIDSVFTYKVVCLEDKKNPAYTWARPSELRDLTRDELNKYENKIKLLKLSILE